ncbi:MAG: hypothetical protein DIU57_003295 [Pseudomonadota bacterium]|nr:MAG: hypothetical protein DIU57_16570 [Pseudomonadota bacterium]
MLPLKTLALAAGLALVLGSPVSACPAHNHMETVQAPASDEATTASSQQASVIKSDAKPAEVASADKPSDPAQN